MTLEEENGCSILDSSVLGRDLWHDTRALSLKGYQTLR